MNVYSVIAIMFYMLAAVLLCIAFTNIQAVGAPVALVFTGLATTCGAHFSVCAMEKRYEQQ